MKRNSQSGIALVITLVLLSVITFMAVTFLVVSRHEGAQVDVISQQSNAKFAAESGAQQAMAQAVAQMQATGNGLTNTLMVSANYLSGTNFVTSGPGYTSITNVSYSNITTLDDLKQMLNNLLILPRPPVFITTNKALGSNDFRYWLDLNRNGIYDPSGSVQVYDSSGALVPNLFTNEVGDPEWIGILNHPDQRHSPSNFFIARYAFIALPIGNSLDINYIHNQAVQNNKMTFFQENGAYFRNQGVGTWEINLAAFFNKLSSNFWPIVQSYNPLGSSLPTGDAFNDAAAIVQYRYNKSYANLSTVPLMYGVPGTIAFTNDFIDGYSTGPLMTGVFPPAVDGDFNAIFTGRYTWSGANNPNAFFSLGDFFSPNLFQTRGGGITNGFSSAGRVNTTDDRYSFYRMLSQMSFGSEPVEYPYQNPAVPALVGNVNFMSAYSNSPRMNLNYKNVNGFASTSFSNWTALEFFTNAADRMLRAYFPLPVVSVVKGQTNISYISITNIPIYPTNYYTPAVHRILQLAANMYDSVNTNQSVDNLTPNGPYFPSVFRPLFTRPNQKSPISITGYTNVVDTNDVALFQVPKDLRRPNDVNSFPLSFNQQQLNVYGVPYIIGARTGWPSFNKFASIPMIQMFRALEIVAPSDGSAYPSSKWGFNVRYEMSISNQIALECWYPSTSNTFPRSVDIYVGNESDMWVTNDAGLVPRHVPTAPSLYITNYSPTLNPWKGSPNLNGTASSPQSFKLVLSNILAVVSNEYLQVSSQQLVAVSNYNNLPFAKTPNYFIPKWGLNITNRVRLIMVDHTTKKVVDFVDLGGLGAMAGPDVNVDINAALAYVDTNSTTTGADQNSWLWVNSSNTAGGIPLGFVNQIRYSLGPGTPLKNIWSPLNSTWGPSQIAIAQSNFNSYMTQRPSRASAQVPLVAYRSIAILNNTWAANDPLVHYMTSDLTSSVYPPKAYDYGIGVNRNPLADSQGIQFGTLNSKRYQPWWVTNNDSSMQDVKNNPIAYKDPLVYNSDQWQFPANKFPNVGWLGRVHRGTPWQTVFLKSAGVDAGNWTNWTGNALTNYFGNNDQLAMQPAQDWLLMDLFTTAPNDNASRGQLSVNQTGAAAWAAVLDGVITLQNTATNLNPWVIDPSNTFTNSSGTVTNTVDYLVSSINATRTAAPSNTFTSVGQILSVPQLTINSPFIDPNNSATLSDAVVERIPQQIMSLLRLGTARYVIFAYGQSLKPADRSIVTSGKYFGMCTNYQITGEMATRTVVRFDNFPTPTHPNTPRAVVESFNVLPPE